MFVSLHWLWTICGVAGILISVTIGMLVLLMTGKVYFQWQVERMFQDKDRLIESLQKQIDSK